MQALLEIAKPSPQTCMANYDIIAEDSREQMISSKKRKSKDKRVSLSDIKEMADEEAKKEEEIRVIDRRKDSKVDPDDVPPPMRSPKSFS